MLDLQVVDGFGVEPDERQHQLVVAGGHAGEAELAFFVGHGPVHGFAGGFAVEGHVGEFDGLRHRRIHNVAGDFGIAPGRGVVGRAGNGRSVGFAPTAHAVGLVLVTKAAIAVKAPPAATGELGVNRRADGENECEGEELLLHDVAIERHKTGYAVLGGKKKVAECRFGRAESRILGAESGW